MEGQIQAVPIVIDEEEPNDLQSMIYGNYRYSDASNSLFKNLSVGLLKPEAQLGAKVSNLIGKPDITPRLLHSNPKENPSKKLIGTSNISKIADSPHKQLPAAAALSLQPKLSAALNSSESLLLNSLQGANYLFKNKYVSDRLEQNLPKNSDKDSSREKNSKLIIIDDEAEAGELFETSYDEKHGKPRVGNLNKELNAKPQNSNASLLIQQEKSDAGLELRNDSSDSKNSVGKKLGSKKVGYEHKIQNLQNISGFQKSSPVEDPINAENNSSRGPIDMKMGIPFSSLPYPSHPLLDYLGMAAGSVLQNAELGGSTNVGGFNPIMQALVNRPPSSMLPRTPQEFLYNHHMFSYLQQLRAAHAAGRIITPFSFLEFDKIGQSLFDREKTKNNEKVQPEEIIQITDDIPDNLAPKVVDIKEGEIDKVIDKGGGKKLFVDNKSSKSILEKAFSKKILAKIERKNIQAKTVELNTIDSTRKAEEKFREVHKEVHNEAHKEEKKKSVKKNKGRGKAKTKAKQPAEELSLQDNLQKPQRRTRGATKPQIPLITPPVVSEIPVKRARRKNKMQLIAEEKGTKQKEIKNNEEPKADESFALEELDEEFEEEEEYASLSDYPNPLKRIKPMKVGADFQAVILPLEIGREKPPAPRKFKSVWDPASFGEQKVKEFFLAVEEILKLNTYHEDFLIRLLAKNQMDFEKTLGLIKTNEEYFVNLFKQKRSFVPLKKLPQQPDLM